MFEKDLNIPMLLDFYGELLTEKQKETLLYYYEDDMSLAEIAANSGISRQGVRDSIKRGENLLNEMENKLGLVKKFDNVKAASQKIYDAANIIQDINKRRISSDEISEKIDEIIKYTEEIV